MRATSRLGFTRVFPAIALGVMLVVIAQPTQYTTAANSHGTRPRNLVVTPAGDAVLATSLGSTFISQTQGTPLTGPWMAPTYIDVFYLSWGITLIDDSTAVVTHPYDTHLSIVKRPNANSPFSYDSSVDLGDAFRYSSEIIASPNKPNHVLVANYGVAPNVQGAEDWNHAIYEVDIATAAITRTFVTERGPRALVASPDGQRLFVGHVQGAMGQAGLVNNHALADNRDANGNFHDGGSILVYDLAEAASVVMPLSTMRFGVGSPVRGLAVSLNDDSSYGLYYTHVGDHANGEDQRETPRFFGGRQIPNVVSNVIFSVTNAPQSIQHAVFAHDPDADPEEIDPDNASTVHPAVLHEKVCVRDYMVSGARTRELWVSNSGSGTVSRATLTTGGTFELEASTEVVQLLKLTRDFSTHDMDLTIVPTTFDVLKKINGGVANHAYVTSPTSEEYSSNPRAIAYDATNDYVWVATQLDNELFALQGQDLVIDNPVRLAVAANPFANPGEREFFGFGRGFEFREVLGDENVGTLACGTCHVDAHTDGKVRLTARGLDNRFPGGNVAQSGSTQKPVTVPSNFDAGQTEWMFFEGLKTIRDGDHGSGGTCLYCQDAGFFDSTEEFTNALSSPTSPYAPNGQLADNQRRGRYLFEAMNCSRCHSGAIAPFDKTNVPLLPAGVPQGGPTPNGLQTANRYLHDPTQSFITDRRVMGPGPQRSQSARVPDLPNEMDDFVSARNVTDVGTRVNIFDPGKRDGFWDGINTPALAGGWNNAPYFHDGRYRTLEQVLKHTWVDPADENRSAPLVLNVTPDNSFDQLPFPGVGLTVPNPKDPNADGIDDGTHLTTLFPFGTHAPTQPTRTSVYDHLTGGGAPYPEAYDDLEAFLRALSSVTDPCAGADDFISQLNVDVDGTVATATWKTLAAVGCDVQWGNDGDLNQTASTPSGTDHTLVMNVYGAGDYAIDITARVRTLCNTKHRGATTFVVADSRVTLSVVSSSDIFCPAGDLSAVNVSVDFDDAQMTGDISASDIVLGVASGGNVALFSSGDIVAETDATAANGYQTTIIHAFTGGFSLDGAATDIPVFVEGLLAGTATLVFKNPDFTANGKVDMDDLADFAVAFGACQNDAVYCGCADFIGSPNCVDLVDLSFYAEHHDHQEPGFQGAPPEREPADIRVSFASVPGGATKNIGRTVVRLQIENVRELSLLEMKLVVQDETVELLSSTHESLLGANAMVTTTHSGEIIVVVAADRPITADVIDLGRLEFARKSSSDDGLDARVKILSGAVVNGSGKVFEISKATVAISDEPPLPGFQDGMSQNYPNPFNPTTVIDFSVADEAHVNLSVFNIRGQLVRTLVDGARAANNYTVEWDGMDNHGNPVSSGMYFYRIKTPHYTQTRKLILLK